MVVSSGRGRHAAGFLERRAQAETAGPRGAVARCGSRAREGTTRGAPRVVPCLTKQLPKPSWDGIWSTCRGATLYETAAAVCSKVSTSYLVITCTAADRSRSHDYLQLLPLSCLRPISVAQEHGLIIAAPEPVLSIPEWHVL